MLLTHHRSCRDGLCNLEKEVETEMQPVSNLNHLPAACASRQHDPDLTFDHADFIFNVFVGRIAALSDAWPACWLGALLILDV